MQLTANYSESEAWATYRLIQKEYASLLGDLEPIFRSPLCVVWVRLSGEHF
jgi:hypothetical protein